MPIYEYECASCGVKSDVLQKLNDPAPEKCERCGAERSLSRVVSRTSFVLKGGGWYSDLYGSAKPSANDSSGSSSNSTSASPPSSDKPPSGDAKAA